MEAQHYPFSSLNNSESDNATTNSVAENQSLIPSSNFKLNTQNTASITGLYLAPNDCFSPDNRQTSDIQKNNLRPNLNRNRDEVYMATKNVVKAIITLSQVVGENKGNNYLELVKDIGFELRKLLQSVDHISPLIPAEAYK